MCLKQLPKLWTTLITISSTASPPSSSRVFSTRIKKESQTTSKHSLSLYNDVLEGDSAELLIENDNEGVKADLVLILRDL